MKVNSARGYGKEEISPYNPKLSEFSAQQMEVTCKRS